MSKNIYENRVITIIYSFFKFKKRDIKENFMFFKRPFLSTAKMLLSRPPWVFRLRDMRTVQINSKDDLFRERFKFLHNDSYTKDSVVKRGTNQKIVKFPLSDNGDIYRAFVLEDYSWLPIEGRIVIDVGSGVGDSAIYFSLKGALHVYGFEPFPSTFQNGLKNIANNGYNDVVTLINKGVGIGSRVNLDQNFKPTNSSSISNHLSKSGVPVELITIKEMLKTINSDSVILKMDCEGCEYDSILIEDCNTIRKFSHIQMEYHKGYKNIKEKLEACGFIVTYEKPIRMKSRDDGSYLYLGYLKAERKD
jgi:FkbM family methyltransferase